MVTLLDAHPRTATNPRASTDWLSQFADKKINFNNAFIAKVQKHLKPVGGLPWNFTIPPNFLTRQQAYECFAEAIDSLTGPSRGPVYDVFLFKAVAWFV